MNIETLNAHLRLLGPAPKGKKWRMVKAGEILEVGDMRCDPSDDNYKARTGMAGQILSIESACETYPNARYWRLVPAPSPAWCTDPLEVTRSILPVEELRRETVDGIIADFIKTVSTEKQFRAYLKAAKKGLEPQDFA